MWIQEDVALEPRPRGFHLVTREVERGVPGMGDVRVGLAHVFIRHTSAALTLNENADPSVRRDFDEWFARAVPDDADYFEHTAEGPDDMTSHIKSSLLGSSVTLPVRDGRFHVGTWQGIYLCEHRERGGSRRLTVTLFGES